MYVVAYYVVGYRYKIVYNNLRHAYPDRDEATIRAYARQFYRYLAEWIVEILKLPTFSEAEMKRRCRITGNTAFTQLSREKHGAIVLTAHLGNWEWAGQRVGLAVEQPLNVVYKALSSEGINQFMKHVRTRFGNEVSSMNEISRKLVKSRPRGLINCYLAAKSPVTQHPSHWPKFITTPTPLFAGPAYDAHRSAPHMQFSCYRT